VTVTSSTARAWALVLFAAGVLGFVVYVWVTAPGISGPEPGYPTTTVSPSP
jgi:hypothetical protein